MESLYACLYRYREDCIARTQGQADKSGNESQLKKKILNFPFQITFSFLYTSAASGCALNTCFRNFYL